MNQRSHLVAFFAGLLFAAGLTVGGMTQPAKVIAFLDFFGEWDPSLAFVMGGAIAVFAPLFPRVLRLRQPLWGRQTFDLPTKKSLDGRLLIGSAIFGVGWGLAGVCPGPGIVGFGSGGWQMLLFSAAMLVGIGLHRAYQSTRKDPAAPRCPTLG